MNTTSQHTDYDTDMKNAHDDSSYTEAELDAQYQAMEDEQFNSSVWEDWETKVQAQVDRDHAISDAQHPIHQMEEYEANCM